MAGSTLCGTPETAQSLSLVPSTTPDSVPLYKVHQLMLKYGVCATLKAEPSSVQLGCTFASLLMLLNRKSDPYAQLELAC